jgi:hypothetical protein
MSSLASGSGVRVGYGRFMEDPQLLRIVAAPGDSNLNPATIEAVEEYINTKELTIYTSEKCKERKWAKDNLLHLQLVMDATITNFDVHVFGTLIGDNLPETSDRWSYEFRQEGYKRSQIITLSQVIPGSLKVMITNVTGSGNVYVYYSITD